MSGFVVEQAGGTPEAAWRAAASRQNLAELDVTVAGRVVVVAPHPDDEILGAGGLIRTLALAGTGVEIWAVTDGEGCFGPLSAGPARALAQRRAEETHLALRRLGVAGVPVRRLRVADGEVSASSDDLASDIAAALGPGDLCVAAWRGDGHPDHEAVGLAAADGSARSGCQLLEYPVWAWYWADPEALTLPRASARLLRLDRPAAAAKRRAISAFASQLGPGPEGQPPVLPAAVLRYFRRPGEVLIG